MSDGEQMLAGIRLEGALGKGRFGPVERGWHMTLERPVAVRVFSPDVSEDAQAMARLADEARALAQLEHPGLVRVYDGGESDGRGYLAMELVEGTSLATRLPLPLPDAVQVTRDVAEVLAWAHERGVVHGGLSAHSILVQEDGRARLSDFGVAALAAGRAGLPEADTDADIAAAGQLLMEVSGAEFGAPLPPRFATVVRRATRVPGAAPFASLRDFVQALDDATQTRSLPRLEGRWLRLIAVAQAVAALALVWTALAWASPQVLARNALAPGVLLDSEAGKPWAGMVLLALGALVLAGGGTAWLWRRWRANGLDRGDPSLPVASADAVFGVGVLGLFVHGVWLLRLEAAAARGEPWVARLPVLPVVLLGLLLAFAAATVLESKRRGRVLKREWYLWAGLALGLVPLLVELVR